MNYYAILGLDVKCSQDDIKKAYKRLALKHHPDKNSGADSEDFKNVNEAYRVLKDPETRQLYDSMHLESAKNESLDKLLTLLMNMIFAFMKQKKEMKKDIKLNISLDLVEVYRCDTKKISLSVKNYSGETQIKNIYIPLKDIQSCYTFEKEGDEYLPGIRSNIVINIEVIDHLEIKRDKILCEYDLYMELPISLFEYYNGVKRVIKHLDGEEFVVECEKNPTVSDYNIIYILRGKGLTYTSDDGVLCRGDFYIHFRLKLPEAIDKSANMLLQHYFNE